jgi:hypothetical protein
MRIAQRFSVGWRMGHSLSPEGTLEFPVAFLSRPFGTILLPPSIPTLKRWAIVDCPFATREV